MATFFEGIGTALLGGIAAMVAVVALELVRLLFNRRRRNEVRGRSLPQNIRRILSKPPEFFERQRTPTREHPAVLTH